MNLVTSQFDKQDKSIQAITAKNAQLNKEIDAQKEKISTLEKALKNKVKDNKFTLKFVYPTKEQRKY